MTLSTDKFSPLLKYIPALVGLSYICGFIVMNTHLLKYGIVDFDILNIRYINAGALYLIWFFFTVASIYSIVKPPFKNRSEIFIRIYTFITCIVVQSIIYTIYSLFFCVEISSENFYLTFIVFAFYSVILPTPLRHLAYEKKMGWIEILLFSLLICFGSMYTFGKSLYGNIKLEVGGGEFYKNIFIVEDKAFQLLPMCDNNFTDTLTVIYEDSEDVYFFDDEKVFSLKEKYVIGKISIKD